MIKHFHFEILSFSRTHPFWKNSINDEIYSIIKETPIDLIKGPAKKILKNHILKKQVL